MSNPITATVYGHRLTSLTIGHTKPGALANRVWRCTRCGVQNKAKHQYVGHPCIPVALPFAFDDSH
jgi:hypothetical protein